MYSTHLMNQQLAECIINNNILKSAHCYKHAHKFPSYFQQCTPANINIIHIISDVDCDVFLVIICNFPPDCCEQLWSQH
jgi:hypothetical protein